MIIITLLGLTFFFAVGYFAYNFSQCLGSFSRLNKFLHTKVIGVVGVLVYIYLVYSNQDALIAALKQPLN